MIILMKWYINNIKGVGFILPLLLFFFLYSDASLKRIDFEVKYKGSSAFTLGIPVSGYCYDKKYTDNIDFVYIWTVNNIYII